MEFAPFAVAGVVASLVFEYIPGVSAWYNGLEDNWQKLFMLGILAAVVAAAFALSCAGWENIYACDEIGAKEAVYAFVAALVGNQAAYLVSPKS